MEKPFLDRVWELAHKGDMLDIGNGVAVPDFASAAAELGASGGHAAWVQITLTHRLLKERGLVA